MTTTTRKVVNIKLTLDFVSREVFILKFKPNVRQDYVFLPSKNPRPVGTEVRFEVSLKSGPRMLRGTGVVEEVKEGGGSWSGMGIRTQWLDSETQAILKEILERNQDDDEATAGFQAQDSGMKTLVRPAQQFDQAFNQFKDRLKTLSGSKDPASAASEPIATPVLATAKAGATAAVSPASTGPAPSPAVSDEMKGEAQILKGDRQAAPADKAAPASTQDFANPIQDSTINLDVGDENVVEEADLPAPKAVTVGAVKPRSGQGAAEILRAPAPAALPEEAAPAASDRNYDLKPYGNVGQVVAEAFARIDAGDFAAVNDGGSEAAFFKDVTAGLAEGLSQFEESGEWALEADGPKAVGRKGNA